MDDRYNLIYNGNLKYGADGWNFNTTSFTMDASSSVNGSYGSFVFSGKTGAFSNVCTNIRIPVNTADTYVMKADVKKDDISGSSTNLFCIMCYDKYGVSVGVSSVLHTGNTTLARDLKDGDTVVYLTSVAGWWTTATYRSVGICESEAWGYNRSIYSQYYDSSTIDTTNNTVTLKAGTTWTGGTWSAGTKVAAFSDGGTYIYPINVTKSDADTWHAKSGRVTASSWRMGTDYILPGMICYKDNAYRVANWVLENESEYQTRKASKGEGKNSIKKTGVVENNNNHETASLKARYIRDWLSGSTANVSNHWVEIRAWDIYGRNVAFGSNGNAYKENGTEIGRYVYRSAPNCQANANYKKFHVVTRGGGVLHQPSHTSKQMAEDAMSQ